MNLSAHCVGLSFPVFLACVLRPRVSSPILLLGAVQVGILLPTASALEWLIKATLG